MCHLEKLLVVCSASRADWRTLFSHTPQISVRNDCWCGYFWWRAIHVCDKHTPFAKTTWQQWRRRAQTPQSWVITGRTGNIKEVRISKQSKLTSMNPLLPVFDHSHPLYLQIFISDLKTDEQVLMIWLQIGNQQIKFPWLTLETFSERGTPSLTSEDGYAQGHFRIKLLLQHHLHNRPWGNGACVTRWAAHKRVGFACERVHGKHMGPADIRPGSDVS